jgi:hypothetical protein
MIHLNSWITIISEYRSVASYRSFTAQEQRADRTDCGAASQPRRYSDSGGPTHLSIIRSVLKVDLDFPRLVDSCSPVPTIRNGEIILT